MLTVLTWRAAVATRWTALVLGSLLVLMYLAFFLGEGPPNILRLTPSEAASFLATLALILGLAAAWKWEGWGGLVSVCGFALLVAIDRRHLEMWAFVVPAIGGGVHFLCWLRLKAGAPTGVSPWHLSRIAVLGLLGALGLFVLLCANEIFGRPPLMAPALHPGVELLGTWNSVTPGEAAIVIHADASVTGTIDGSPILAAWMNPGRSWFGRLLHINADYVIRGQIGGGEFSAPLMERAQGLEGSIFRNNRPASLALRKR